MAGILTVPSTRLDAGDQAAPLPSRARSGAPAPARQGSLEQLQQELTAITMMPGVERAVWGVVVHSLDRGERLFELNPRTLLVPASTAKLLTVATAIDAAGWNYRFETTLQTSGRVVDGVLHGDLVVAGSGDPSIGGRGGDDFTAWIEALKMLGVGEIDGRIIGDDDFLEEPRPQFGWAWDDLATSGALYGALNFEENRMAVTVTAGLNAGEAATLGVEPVAAERPLLNRVLTGDRGSAQRVWAEQRPGEILLAHRDQLLDIDAGLELLELRDLIPIAAAIERWSRSGAIAGAVRSVTGRAGSPQRLTASGVSSDDGRLVAGRPAAASSSRCRPWLSSLMSLIGPPPSRLTPAAARPWSSSCTIRPGSACPVPESPSSATSART